MELINTVTQTTESKAKKDEFYRNKRLHGGTFANTFMYIDELCNMSCTHCYMGDRLVNPEKMQLEEIEKTLDYFKTMKTRKCTIIGGEPTLSKNLMPTIKMINERGFDCIINTNGWFKPTFLNELSHDELEYISFSVDGSTAELHDKQRRKGSFKRVIEAIEYAVNLGFEARIIPTITKDNQFDAENILAMADRLGVSMVNFHTVTHEGNAKDNEDELMLRPEEWIAFYRDLEKNRGKYKVKVWYPPTYAHLDDMIRYNERGYGGCLGRTMDRLSVFPGGSSYVCSLFFDEDKEHNGETNGYFGTMKNGNLEMNLTQDNEVRHFMDSPAKCLDCQYLDVCHSGCPYQRKINQENFCGSDKPENKLIPMCRLWKTEVIAGE